MLELITFCMLYGAMCEPCPTVRDWDTSTLSGQECCCPDVKNRYETINMLKLPQGQGSVGGQ